MTANPVSGPTFRFVALMAFLVSCVALGIDLMLASLVQIGRELSPAAPENATLVMGSFFMALGVATFFVGPLLDAWGRRPVILGGLGLYALGGLLSWLAPSLTLMLLGRALMGVGAAAPRVGVQAIIRDRYSGRQMAATISIVMMIFTLVPGIAPVMGAWIADAFGWRAVFFVFIIFGAGGAAWFAWQQPETLTKPQPLNFRVWIREIRDAFRLPVFRQSMTIQLFTFASLYGFLTAGPAIFSESYGIPGLYPYIFGGVSLLGAFAAFANSRLVKRLGMVVLSRVSLMVYSAINVVSLIAMAAGAELWSFVAPMFFGFFVLGFVIGNAQALAMEPLGHIAGTASATLVAVATLGAGLLASPLPLMFGSDPMPFIAGTTVFGAIALWAAMRLAPD
ncbi:MAG: MFS transporter [Rhodobacteraceae bacterium]|nr:MFS transporter [Paracoccaceae bacterium]